MVQALKQYGILLLGQKIHWVGFGGFEADETDRLLDSYNFVDSSYGYVMINYGMIILVLVLVGAVLTGKYVRVHYSIMQTILFVGMLVYCFIEPRLLELHMNTMLFLAAPVLNRGRYAKMGKTIIEE